MKFAFITFGSFDFHATLKRATGMAGPLIARGHEVHLLLEDSLINREKVTSECPEAKVHWHICARSPLAERRVKQQTLKQILPDVVWICGVGLRNWVFRPSCSTVLLGDHSELFSQVNSGRVRRLVYGAIEWLYCFAFDGHICASRYLESFYEGRLKRLGKDPGRVHYLPYAFHPGVIHLDPEGASVVQAKYPGKKIILYMGSFWKNYGFWDMLKAFERIREQRNDFVAIFAGRGPEKEKGARWVKEKELSNSIIIEGYVPEESLSAYFGAAHAFLSPLRDTIQDWARCPSKLFMYLLFKKPVITCPIGEAKELFGEDGAYYEPGNMEALINQIVEQLNEETPASRVNPLAHTDEARAEQFLKWFGQTFGQK